VYQAPVTFSWVPGSRHTITWPSTLGRVPADARLIPSHRTGRMVERIRARSGFFHFGPYTRYIKVSISSPWSWRRPGQASDRGSFSGDGYYDSGASVQIQATPAPGYNLWYVQPAMLR